MPYIESEVKAAIKDQYSIESNFRYLHPTWRKRRKESKIASTGFCYLAAHAYYELMGGAGSLLTMMKYVEKGHPVDGHFWIEKENGERVDLTADQYSTGFNNYENGVVIKRPKLGRHAVKFTEIVRKSLEQNQVAQASAI